jgi:hypothetical protein
LKLVRKGEKIKNRFASKKRRKTFLDDIRQTLMLENFVSSESRAMLCINHAESRQKINEVKNAMAFAKRGKKEPSMWGQRPPTPSNLRGGA